MWGDGLLIRIALGITIGFVAGGPLSVALTWPATTTNVVIDLPPPGAQ